MSEIAEPSVWGLSPIVAILVAAALPTHIWRWLGVLFAGRMDETSEVFVWVKAVATALVAALIAKLILMPTGPLGLLPASVRVGAALLALGVYVAAGKRLAIGIAAGELVIVAAWLSLR
ncbi:AzlD domain-containing protein [Acuticoccus sp. MNP-M23]|uniref:AzlD domain-containing protein n=1 Tax=Acuticoccus sp. MNP-M23 TaxID=3072793 RepID=UPI0028163E77|nr:AzlD domain-containing protein [Acuticoccus sp. MNP-M23]WMS42855.1 AzlD domain-containing protein [Acuticoccus sp. MNP-M23]